MSWTSVRNDAHVRTNASKCPECDGHSLECDEYHYDSDQIAIEMTCLDCLYMYFDVYKLSGYEHYG